MLSAHVATNPLPLARSKHGHILNATQFEGIQFAQGNNSQDRLTRVGQDFDSAQSASRDFDPTGPSPWEMLAREGRIGRGDDTVGNPHRAQNYQFEFLELKFINLSFSSSNLLIRAFRAYPLIEIRPTVPCRAIRGNSSDSRQQYLSQQYPPHSYGIIVSTAACQSEDAGI